MAANKNPSPNERCVFLDEKGGFGSTKDQPQIVHSYSDHQDDHRLHPAISEFQPKNKGICRTQRDQVAKGQALALLYPRVYFFVPKTLLLYRKENSMKSRYEKCLEEFHINTKKKLGDIYTRKYMAKNHIYRIHYTVLRNFGQSLKNTRDVVLSPWYLFWCLGPADIVKTPNEQLTPRLRDILMDLIQMAACVISYTLSEETFMPQGACITAIKRLIELMQKLRNTITTNLDIFSGGTPNDFMLP